MKPRIISGFTALTLALLVMCCADPISTRAYFRYVQPQPPSPKAEEVVYVAVKKIRGYGTGYFGPKKEDYATEREYVKAVNMNGRGKETKCGTKPRFGTLAADTRFHPFGTVIFIPEINFWGKVEDIGSRVKGEKHVDIFCGHGKEAERIANMWGAGTPITLMIMKKKGHDT